MTSDSRRWFLQGVFISLPPQWDERRTGPVWPAVDFLPKLFTADSVSGLQVWQNICTSFYNLVSSLYNLWPISLLMTHLHSALARPSPLFPFMFWDPGLPRIRNHFRCLLCWSYSSDSAYKSFSDLDGKFLTHLWVQAGNSKIDFTFP